MRTPKIKESNLDLRKIIVDIHKAGDGHAKLSHHFQVSRTGLRQVWTLPTNIITATGWYSKTEAGPSAKCGCTMLLKAQTPE